MKHAVETKVVVGLGLVLGAGMALGTPAFAQRTTESARERGVVVVDLSDDMHETPGAVEGLTWEATPIADPAHVPDQGGVIRDYVAPASKTGIAFGGSIRDAGTIVIDLNEKATALVLSFAAEPLADPHAATKLGVQPVSYHLRLSGGEPLQPAAIVVRNDQPQDDSRRAFLAGGAVIQGVFGMDGSFVVEVPEDVLRHPLFARGFAIGGAQSGSQILMPKPSKTLLMQMDGVDAKASATVVLEPEGLEVSWSAEPIADAAHGIFDRTPEGSWTQARFYGHGTFAGLDDVVDITVDLREEPQGGGFTLRLSDDLAERTALVSLGDASNERQMRFASIDELAQAVADVAVIDAFSDELEISLSWSAQSLADARLALKNAYGQRQSIMKGGPGGRPARNTKKFAPQAGPTTLVERTVDLEEGGQIQADVADVMRIPGQPHTANKPARSKDKAAARYTGQIADGGDVTVKLAGPGKLGRVDGETLRSAERVVDLAHNLRKLLRENGDLESASSTLEIKRANLKSFLARSNGV